MSSAALARSLSATARQAAMDRVEHTGYITVPYPAHGQHASGASRARGGRGAGTVSAVERLENVLTIIDTVYGREIDEKMDRTLRRGQLRARRARSPGPNLAAAAGQGDRAFHRGRQHRHPGADHLRAPVGGARPAIHHREPRRRERRDRSRARREGPGRRLYAVLCRHHAIPDRAAHTKGELRSAEGLRADLGPRHQPVRTRHPYLGAGEYAQGVHRLREGAPRGAQLLLGRQGRRDPRHSGAVRLACRAQDDPYSVQEKRAPQFPDLPAIAELYPGFRNDTWNGFFAPAATPRAIIDRVAREVAKAARDPDIIERLDKIGVDALGNTPTEFAALIRSGAPVWRDAVEAAGIKQE